MSAAHQPRGQAAASAGGDGRPTVPRAEPRSYYGLPVLNAPVWSWEIPVYFFAGGMAGAAAPLALAASLRGERRLARSASAVALAGVAVSPPLLISDLGQPRRFLNMLRMFKVTSPMSVGAWILSAFAPAVLAGAGRELLGVLPAVGRAGQVGGALLGPALSTYTAALLATTSVPVWHEARRELPFVFAGSSLASAGAAATALAGPAACAPARRMAVGGAALSLTATVAMERRLGALAAPYRAGSAHPFALAAKGLVAAGGLTLALATGRPSACGPVVVIRRLTGSRPARGLHATQAAGAVALLAGAALERWAIVRAGTDSAADPTATIGPQRARRERA
jgi:formate-dependent nitrite reductase membrane component NrfD